MNMATIQSPQMGWSPTPGAGPKWRPSLSQSVTAATMTPPTMAPAKAAFLDSALVSAIFTGLGTAALAQLSYGAAYQKAYGKSRFYSILAGGMGALTLYSLYNVREE